MDVSDDIEALTRKVTEAGGTVVAPPLDIPGQGRMAVFQDPTGAFISAWQAAGMSGFGPDVANGYGWTELNARGVGAGRPTAPEALLHGAALLDGDALLHGDALDPLDLDQ